MCLHLCSLQLGPGLSQRGGRCHLLLVLLLQQVLCLYLQLRQLPLHSTNAQLAVSEQLQADTRCGTAPISTISLSMNSPSPELLPHAPVP
jgi:hypothetical protein